MRTWLQSLESRERLFVVTAAVVVIIAIIYVFIWAPLDRGHDNLSSSVATWERSLAELRPLKGLAQATNSPQSQAPVASQQTPVVIVDQTLRARGLDRALKRSQPTTSSGIRVEFENVAFDDLVLWLGDLAGQFSMHVQSGSLTTAAHAGPGRINATLTLEREF